MTDKEKLEKIKRLADAMYNKMAYLTSDTRPIRQAMEDYHNFIVHEYNKDEQVDKPIDFEQELYKAFGQVKDFTLGMRIAKWFYDMGKNSQEPTSGDLGEYINELSKQFPEVSFAKLSRIAVRVAKWQKEQFEKERLKHCDGLTDEQAQIESDFVAQHLKDNNRTPTFIDAIEYGMKMQKEQMMAKTIYAVVSQVPCANEIILRNPESVHWFYLPQEMNKLGVNKGDKVKVIVIKED